MNVVRPLTHEQIKYPLFEQFLDRYEVNLLGFAQMNSTLFAQILAELHHTDRIFEQIKSINLLHVYGHY